MPMQAQVRLLRVLQDGDSPSRWNQVIKTDVRVIVASNIDLEKGLEGKIVSERSLLRLSVFSDHDTAASGTY